MVKPQNIIHFNSNPFIFFTGKGACRGEGWQASPGWPMVLGQKTLLHCGNACAYTLGCTAFDVRPNDAKKLDCNLFSHSNVEPASGVPGKYLSCLLHVNHQS